MSTVALFVQQEGLYQGWSSIVGGTDASDVVSDSSDSSYLLVPKSTASTGTISFPMWLQADGPIPTSIQIVVRARRDTIGSPTMLVGFARGGLAAFDATVDTLTGSVLNFTHNFSTDPIAGGAWTEADMDGLEVCVQRESLTLGVGRIIKISGTMVYAQTRSWRGLQVKSAQLG